MLHKCIFFHNTKYETQTILGTVVYIHSQIMYRLIKFTVNKITKMLTYNINYANV